MIAFDLLGAGEGLASQAIVLRVRSIDPEKFKASLTGAAEKWRKTVSPAVNLVDWQPQIALDTAIPIVKRELAARGVVVDLYAAPVPSGVGGQLPIARDPKALRKALFVGGVAGALLALAVRWVYHQVHARVAG